MKRKKVWIFCLVVCLVGCSGGKLRVIETKVISESEPYTEPKKELLDGILYMSFANVGCVSREYVDIYTSYGAPYYTNEMKEVADGDRNTMWLSRDNVLNESLWFRVYYLTGYGVKRKDRLPYAMDILPGWAKDKKTFRLYNRPKKIRLELYEVPYHNAVSQYDESYVLKDRIRLVYSVVVELSDEIGWHRISINKKEEEYPTEISSGRLVIEDVYPGKTNLTAISEIRFLYRETEK